MIFRSKLCIKFAISIMSVLVTAFNTHAQMSVIPTRHRTNQEFGRKERQGRGQQQRRHDENKLRSLEGDFSLPPQESEFGMSVPSGPTVRMMSIPLQDSILEMSMPLKESGFDFSMPIEEFPTQDLEDMVTLGNVSRSDGSTLILASFLAGISALVVGFMAFVVKLQQKLRRQAREWQQRQDMQIPIVSFPTRDELEAMEREELEIDIL